MNSNKTELHAAFVWLFSALALFTYGIAGLMNAKIPGVEQLVGFISNADSSLIYFTAFLSVFIEGLYIVGAFFPGSTLVIVVAMLSQLVVGIVFLLTILSIFVGWCLAGVLNILIGRQYIKAVVKQNLDRDKFVLRDRVWTTWFPSFRGSYEVSQIVEGGEPWQVFLSSVRVKFWASAGLAIATLALSYFIDINEVSNEEGIASLFIIALITLFVGVIKLRRYFKPKSNENSGI
jgi:hypothetical protein